MTSPRIGIVVKPLAAISIYGSYTVSHLPSAGDQFSSLTLITQQLKPERFTSYEVGSKWNVRNDLTFTAAVYRQDRTNTRAIDPNDPGRILQTGSQRSEGFELELNGNVSQRWAIVGGYAHQSAIIVNATAVAPPGARVALVPHQTFSLWNRYQLAAKVGVGLGIIRRADVFTAIDNKVMLPAFTRADLAVYIPFNERWKFQCFLGNVLNTKYYVTADGNNNISPGTPRNARVSLQFAF